MSGRGAQKAASEEEEEKEEDFDFERPNPPQSPVAAKKRRIAERSPPSVPSKAPQSHAIKEFGFVRIETVNAIANRRNSVPENTYDKALLKFKPFAILTLLSQGDIDMAGAVAAAIKMTPEEQDSIDAIFTVVTIFMQTVVVPAGLRCAYPFTEPEEESVEFEASDFVRDFYNNIIVPEVTPGMIDAHARLFMKYNTDSWKDTDSILDAFAAMHPNGNKSLLKMLLFEATMMMPKEEPKKEEKKKEDDVDVDDF